MRARFSNKREAWSWYGQILLLRLRMGLRRGRGTAGPWSSRRHPLGGSSVRFRMSGVHRVQGCVRETRPVPRIRVLDVRFPFRGIQGERQSRDSGGDPLGGCSRILQMPSVRVREEHHPGIQGRASPKKGERCRGNPRRECVFRARWRGGRLRTGRWRPRGLRA